MVSLKRKIYGLPVMRWYRKLRAVQIAEQPRQVREGFFLQATMRPSLMNGSVKNELWSRGCFPNARP